MINISPISNAMTRRFFIPLLLIGALLALIPFFLNGGPRKFKNPIDYISKEIGHQAVPVKPRTITPRGDLSASEEATIRLFKQASRSVVFITTLAVKRDFFSLDAMQIPQGNGSGFMWDDKGHIVTNNHVIQNADAAQVTLENGTSYPAELIGTSPENDLAVLRIKAKPHETHAIEVGRSEDLLVGQSVLAIGNPFGLDHTLSKGVISGLGRALPSPKGGSITGLIQTDAAINPGNSGGPLLDSTGRLIGVNTAIFSPTGAYAGIGFAIPVDTVNRVVPQLISYGRVIRPRIGIHIGDDSLLHRIGIKGVLILGIEPGSAAEKAGLRGTTRTANGRILLGDIIIGIDGKNVNSTGDLFRQLENYKAGDTVTVQIQRKRSKLDLRLNLMKGS